MTEFVKINADLHIHSPFAGGVSEKMSPHTIAQTAPLKGLHLIGTGDILNENWIKIIQEQLQKTDDESIFMHKNGTKFILQTEIADDNRVHHIILFPSLSKVYELREKFARYCTDLDKEGRPSIHLNGEQIAEICSEANCLLGFSHAFTPYFGLYSKFNSYKECYGKNWDKIYFMELGMSADTDMADRILELHNLTFTSNSDAHSAWANRIGREFTQFLMEGISFAELEKALKRVDGRKAILNVKFNPLEGRYHKTRCTGCLKFFEPAEAKKFWWRCPNCKKPIKKGVDWRIEELSDVPANNHPEHRPPCLHIIPLSEIISMAIKVRNPWAQKVQDEWMRFVKTFGTEIDILINKNTEELATLNKEVAKYIEFFREGKIKYIPGGAGIYGKLIPPGENADIDNFTGQQKSLTDF